MNEQNMNEQNIAKGIGLIVWGYLVLAFSFYINVNAFRVEFISDWLGYVLILMAIPLLKEKESSIGLLKNLGEILAGMAGILWVLDILGMETELYNFYIIELCAVIIAVYFHFQLLTNIASIALEYDQTSSERLLILRTVKVLLLTSVAFIEYWMTSTWVTMVVVIVSVVVEIWICIVLYGLKKKIDIVHR